MNSDRSELRQGFEKRLARMGLELVQLEWAGHAGRPVIRLRIERRELDRGVTLGDCAAASRALEPWLDGEPGLASNYVLEVSSPGLERPLVRGRDFERFRGRRVALKGNGELHGGSARLEGELLGLACAGDGTETVLLRLSGGDEVGVPRARLKGVNLVHEWESR